MIERKENVRTRRAFFVHRECIGGNDPQSFLSVNTVHWRLGRGLWRGLILPLKTFRGCLFQITLFMNTRTPLIPWPKFVFVADFHHMIFYWNLTFSWMFLMRGKYLQVPSRSPTNRIIRSCQTVLGSPQSIEYMFRQFVSSSQPPILLTRVAA